ncbi:MAG: hypothetical protein RMJ53_07260, partial [Chitinophagales bacterium]|nr:hypothetical protein [Chitinophagales bacterium]MDW8274008.1 hypothetical protein [Chitinophagales bacterium]
MAVSTVKGVEILAPVTDTYAEILTPDALEFIALLHRRFNERRLELLEARQRRQKEIDSGK